MLKLGRRVGEKVFIDLTGVGLGVVEVLVADVGYNRVHLCFTADDRIPILRDDASLKTRQMAAMHAHLQEPKENHD